MGKEKGKGKPPTSTSRDTPTEQSHGSGEFPKSSHTAIITIKRGRAV